MDVNDRALWFELVCSGNEIVQGFVLGIEIFIQQAEVSVFRFQWFHFNSLTPP
jgi:hypothetical protein